MEAEEFLWNRNPEDLAHFDGYFIVGGFSYEDRSRAGIVASLDPLMPRIKAEAKKGKLVLGICNGAQILVETGMVPGLADDALGMALAENRPPHFYNAWIEMKLTAPPGSSAFTKHLKPDQSFRIPVAHGEGRFMIPPELLFEMKQKHLDAFRYFPVSPNGAVDNLAAVTNAAGNVMAMMPHPERTPDGQPIFTSMRDSIADEKKITSTAPLYWKPTTHRIEPFRPTPGKTLTAVELLITDNAASTVEATLRRQGFPIRIKRAVAWETAGEPAYNPRKERMVEAQSLGNTRILIRAKDDETDRGVLWGISFDAGATPEDIFPKLLATNIFFNPYSQNCYSLTQLPMEQGKYEEEIRRGLNQCVTTTDLGIGLKRAGKVRDTYDAGDKLILVTTDRLSAFDRILAAIPYKGQVLNQVSAWWFEQTKHIVPNHVLSVPDPNVTIGKKCTVFPVEFVVRGYITGSTATSAWVNYEKGVRNYCGQILPEGLRKNQKFDRALITPTTKSDEHDRLISPEEIVREGLMTQADWDYASRKALELFEFGQRMAASHGLILVDTKYEFGKDANGVITLLDEIHTPDSSRYWIAATYAERFTNGLEPENIDKEFLRLWFKDHSDPYKDKDMPKAPSDLIVELSRRYIRLYETITGQTFQFPDPNINPSERIKKNIVSHVSYINAQQPQSQVRSPKSEVREPAIKTVLILGSDKDTDHAKKITDALDACKIPHEQFVASAHKEAGKALQILEKYKNDKVIYITIAGRSNALSGFVAGNSSKVTIACPPFADKTDMLVNIHSTIQMPSNVPVMTILEPANVALAVKRMIELSV